jgi:hypothetical protein
LVVDIPVSSLIAGSKMLTAEVFAFTTSVAMQVAASTPVAPLDATACGSAEVVIVNQPPACDSSTTVSDAGSSVTDDPARRWA